MYKPCAVISINLIMNSLDFYPVLMQRSKFVYLISFILYVMFLSGCSSEDESGAWDMELNFDGDRYFATLKLESKDGGFDATMTSFLDRNYNLENLTIADGNFSVEFSKWGDDYMLKGVFKGNELKGDIYLDGEKTSDSFIAKKQSNELVVIDRSNIEYLLDNNAIKETEQNIDHAGIMEELDRGAMSRGKRIYNNNCINCHGNPELEGSIPTSLKFWKQPFKTGSDPFSMYQTITKGIGQMPPSDENDAS